MPGVTTCPEARSYPVEVSGWDCMQDFFVERCDLVWSEETGKQVALKQNLTENAVLFVRLLESEEADRSHPVVYEARHLGKSKNGLHQFRLKTVTPREQETWGGRGPGAGDRIAADSAKGRKS